ncbi:MAG: amidohydrolase family protein, partial [Caulobacteraceae bacterium]
MTFVRFAFAAIFLASGTPLATQAQAQPAGVETTFVQAGRLLADPATGFVQTDKTLVIRGNQVVEVRDGLVGPDNAGDRVVDLRNAFVLPGLIDSHVHLTGQSNPNQRLEGVTQSDAEQAMIGARYARRTLLAGFTTVADLGGSNEAVFALRDAVKRGDVPG